MATRRPEITVTIDPPAVAFRDQDAGTGAIFTGSGAATVHRRDGGRTVVKIGWQILEVDREDGTKAMEVRSLRVESPDGPIGDGLLAGGMVRRLTVAFERWLIENGELETGDGLGAEMQAYHADHIAVWCRWRGTFLARVRGTVQGPRRGRPPDDAGKKAALAERVVQLGADHYDWLQRLADEMADKHSYDTLKAKVNRLRNDGWLARQDGERRPPQPGPRLFDFRVRTVAAAPAETVKTNSADGNNTRRTAKRPTTKGRK